MQLKIQTNPKRTIGRGRQNLQHQQSKNLRGNIIMSSNVTLKRYKDAYRDMIKRREKKAFTIHAIPYAIGNSILIAINLAFIPQFLWFIFRLIGWGSGLAIHYYLGIHTAPRHIVKDEIMSENMTREGLSASFA
jgi:hypothetical protein